MDGMVGEREMRNTSPYTILSLYNPDYELEFRSVEVT